MALPCLHLVARVFPNAQRFMLTNKPVHSKAPRAQDVIEGSGLVTGYIEFDLAATRRSWRSKLDLARRLRQWNPQVLVYLSAQKSLARVLTEVAFFRLCGIRRIIGVPWRRSLRQYRWCPEHNRYEQEADRLARCIAALGDANPRELANWSLHLSNQEKEQAERWIDNWPGRGRFIAVGAGTKVEVNDWGLDNWYKLITLLGKKYASWGLLLVGANEEFERSEKISRQWAGPRLNLCGRVTPRHCAALLESATLFLGHDSGPTHLAARGGVSSVAIFSARNLPGAWFPYGRDHEVIYHQTACYNCSLETCKRFNKQCITSITVEEVGEAVDRAVARLRIGGSA